MASKTERKFREQLWVDELLKWKSSGPMPYIFDAAMHLQNLFEPLPSDVILASYPKTGTTWLKALTISILAITQNKPKSLHSSETEFDDDLLQDQNPHELIPFLEYQLLGEKPLSDLDPSWPSRVFSTHLPYSLLPEKTKNLGCRIVYITRNPADTFISSWEFFKKGNGVETTLEMDFDKFCRGISLYGSFFDHVLEYWNETRDKENILYLTYEELKEEPERHTKRLADFLGYALNPEEISRVTERCDFGRLTKLDVNKDETKVHWTGMPFSTFFRRGIIGDSRNYLTPEMVDRLYKVASEKWGASGLVSKLLI